MMRDPIIKTTTNDYGITVNKTCMSCAHKQFTRSNGKRRCGITLKEHDRYDLCDKWAMSEAMKEAGSGRGEVRNIKSKKVINI